tara:strand:- start:967 stop:1470 length:504 start_codon:yes stop_codon:yes gene_type:complete
MININSGLQRIYLVGSISWVIIFLFLGWNGGLYSKFTTYLPQVYLSTDSTCIDRFDKKILKKVSARTYEVLLDLKLKNPPYKGKKIKYVTSFSPLGKESCLLSYKRKFFDRIQEGSLKYIYLAFAPIPLYFILLFVINGFKKPNTKPIRKRVIKKKTTKKKTTKKRK